MILGLPNTARGTMLTPSIANIFTNVAVERLSILTPLLAVCQLALGAQAGRIFKGHVIVHGLEPPASV
jgi:hypothetical protein